MAEAGVIILTEQARDEAVTALLELYAQYHRAWFPSTKRRIGEKMRFADPIVWMRYKFLAYQGTTEALTTWDDLVNHSFSHDGICGKRLHWLITEAAKQGVDILSAQVLVRHTTIDVVSQLPIITTIAASPEAMKKWHEHEYYTEAGRVRKWSNYPIALFCKSFAK